MLEDQEEMRCTWFFRCLRTVQTSLMRKLELFFGENLFPMEELDEDEDGVAIIWGDKYCIDMIHSSTHTSISSSSSGDENWVKEFSLLVKQEDLEAYLGVHDNLLNEPSPSQKPHRHILLSLGAIKPHMDWVEYYMPHMVSSCRKILLMGNGR